MLWESILSAVVLDALDDLDQAGVDLLCCLDAADLGDDVLGSVLGHDGRELLGLVVTLDVLETEGHLDGIEEEVNGHVVLGSFGSRADEALLARQLAQGSTANALDGIFQVGVADALDDLVHVGLLGVLVDAVLGDEQVLGLGQGAAHLGHDLLVLQGVEDGALSAVVAVVGGGGVAGVDGVELALDEGGQVVDPVDALDGGDADVLEGGLVDNPLEELLERDVEAGVGVLGRDDAVNGRVGIAGTEVVRVEASRVGVPGVLDVAGEGVGGSNGVLAGNDMQGSLLVGAVCAAVDALCDDGGDELEDVGADGAGDDVGGADLLDQLLLVGPGVDGAVVCDCALRGAL